MSRRLTDDLPELVAAGVISEETAEKIRIYYEERSQHAPNRLLIAFGILGALLVGLGIILIIAHNWDNLSTSVKTVFAFLPLLVGQGFCWFTLLKKQYETAWIEASATFLILAVGASISLVSQIYNIPGDFNSFLFTWLLLSIPLVYILRSSIASMLYLVGSTVYACQLSYWSYPYSTAYEYWGLLLLVLPHYYRLYKLTPQSNFFKFHSWFIPLSLTICLGIMGTGNEEFMVVAYFSLFSIFYILGTTPFFQKQKIINNGYLVVGSLGMVGILLSLSFEWYWEELYRQKESWNNIVGMPEFWTAIIVSAIAGLVFVLHYKNINWKQPDMMVLAFLFLILFFAVGLMNPVLPIILVNILITLLGLSIIKKGADFNHLGLLNFGLLVVAALVVCRFFDVNISFVVRGVLFVLVGLGFFLANYWMMKKRKISKERI